MNPKSEFRRRVAAGLRDKRVVQAVRLATLHKVEARKDSLAQLRDPEALRELAAQIKQHTLENLPRYLEQFVAAAERSGARLYFAADGRAARQIICEIADRSGSKLAVKSKSMTTEEVHLNDALQSGGVRIVETDLGEFIVQIDHDRPSHIVTPIIHKDRRQIARALVRETGCEYSEDPTELTAIARKYLRDVFRRCDLGISGVNFGIAETGTICICTNEGNGRLTVTRPRVHVALMGIEKLVPRLRDLSVLLKLLARSSTGQPLTVYTTLITGPKRPRDPDGPEEVHIVLLDNGRSEILAGPFAEVLRCIRCGACLNACPVFRNIGGHAYGSVYPGPIGSLVTPLLRGMTRHAELPRASSLCGACQVACPVKIDIPALLVKLRERTRDQQPLSKRVGMTVWKWIMQSPALLGWTQRSMRWLLRPDGDGWISRGPGPAGEWLRIHDLPPLPKKSFRQRWREGLGDEN
ncbi:MAG: LutB/LldF family L-lactate oxidation iron-sulfur protein [Phycisphaerae bacterium]